jgi:hypothetical protein
LGGKNIMVIKGTRYTTRVTAAGINYDRGHLACLEIFRKAASSTPRKRLKDLPSKGLTCDPKKKIFGS